VPETDNCKPRDSPKPAGRGLDVQLLILIVHCDCA
jgi:hypothetical protein